MRRCPDRQRYEVDIAGARQTDNVRELILKRKDSRIELRFSG